MAATTTILSRGQIGILAAKVVNVTLDTSYPTGGYVLTPGMFGMTTIVGFIPAGEVAGYNYEFIPTIASGPTTGGNLKLRYTTDSHSHTENTAAAYTQNAVTAVAASQAGAEVAAAANLATVVIPVLVLGFGM